VARRCVVTADSLSIEAEAGQRAEAIVLDPTTGAIGLMLGDRAFTSEMLVDESLHSPPGDRSTVSSRQVWLTHQQVTRAAERGRAVPPRARPVRIVT
jgi:hypothetical protein